MPTYAVKCEACGKEWDRYSTIAHRNDPCETCGAPIERLHKLGTVIGDEIDVEIKHGLCNADGSPRRFRSREELKRAEAKAGMVNYVVHRGSRGGDKSKHTSRWY